MPLAKPSGGGLKYAKVIKTEEKEPVRIVRQELVFPVGIVNPHRHASRALAKEASFVKQIRKGVLKNSQFPRNAARSTRDHHQTAHVVTAGRRASGCRGSSLF